MSHSLNYQTNKNKNEKYVVFKYVVVEVGININTVVNFAWLVWRLLASGFWLLVSGFWWLVYYYVYVVRFMC